MVDSDYELRNTLTLLAKKHEAKGRADGEARGRVEGEARGRAFALLGVLEARGLRVSDRARACVLASTDMAELDVWVRKALTVDSVEDLFS